jgi:hypothetical protein
VGMWWKKSGIMQPRTRHALVRGLLAATVLATLALPIHGATVPRKIRAVDADNHLVLLNRTGVVTLVIGTSQSSQEAARVAGELVYPFQGRADFQLVVAVDLHDSLATWAPGIAINQMKSNLDDEAIELKPWFLKNGNKSNPRVSCHVIPDFKGSLFAELGWPKTSSDLRALVFGYDGREYKRFDKVENMNVLFNAVRSAIADYLSVKRAHVAGGPPTPVTRSTALSPVMSPLPPEKPVGP